MRMMPSRPPRFGDMALLLAVMPRRCQVCEAQP
jgi:hypothetical protein